jgi:sulfite reductase beta subunit-like hemoprotein
MISALLGKETIWVCPDLRRLFLHRDGALVQPEWQMMALVAYKGSGCAQRLWSCVAALVAGDGADKDAHGEGSEHSGRLIFSEP